MWLMLATLPHVAQAGISDEELRRLFIVTGQEATPYQYGGVVLFKSYFEANGTACGFKQRYPDTTVFVDQEGGKVVRIAGAAPPSPEASRGMTDQHFYDQVVQSAKKLKAACVDVNLAPVVEIADDLSRSYGAKLDQVVPKAKRFSLAMQSVGVRTVLKHFPGWNEHCKSLTELNSIKLKVRPNSEAARCSVRPGERQEFMNRAAVFTKVPANAWMVGNNIIAELGPYPSNMNPVIHDLIRNELGYKGLLISDALWEVEASPKAVLMSLKVVDWVMVGNPRQVEAALPLIRRGVATGLFTEEELRAKLNRIAAFQRAGGGL